MKVETQIKYPFPFSVVCQELVGKGRAAEERINAYIVRRGDEDCSTIHAYTLQLMFRLLSAPSLRVVLPCTMCGAGPTHAPCTH